MREMGMDMRERLARAMREEIVRQYRDDERGKCPAGANYYEEMVSPYLIADAVLAALREPTPEMLEAAFDVPARSVAGAYAPDGDIEIEENGPTLIWQAMLAAAK